VALVQTNAPVKQENKIMMGRTMNGIDAERFGPRQTISAFILFSSLLHHSNKKERKKERKE
jgi:hypothetical protein